mgnify:CR=1 FL=1
MSSRILVLDANQRSSLAVTRSLGSKNLWVIAADTTQSTLAGSSKFCQETAIYRSPIESPEFFFADVLSIIEKHAINFVIPATEESSYVLVENRQALPSSVILPLPAGKSVEQLANKNELFKLADTLNLPTPETHYISDVNHGIEVVNKATKFPLVLKPYKSKILVSNRIIPTAVVIAHSKTDALAALENNTFREHPFMIQSYIEGEGQGLFALYSKGKPVCYFSHRRLREKPPGGGVSVLSESKSIDPTMKEIADKLLSKVNWEGVAMVEFKVDNNGTPYLMEINTRFWGSLQLAIDSGVDFPYLLYKIYNQEAVEKITDFSVGQKLRWLLGDVDRLYIVLKSPNKVYSPGRKLVEIIKFLLPHLQTKHEINRLYDLGPFKFELRNYFKSLGN